MRGSQSVTEWAFGTDVPRPHLLVLLALASYADRVCTTKTEIWPSASRLAVMARKDVRTTRRSLAWLKRHGLIEVIEVGVGGRSNRYIVGPSVQSRHRQSDVQNGVLDHREAAND